MDTLELKDTTNFFIDSGDISIIIMYLVASVRPSVCPSVRPSVRLDVKGRGQILARSGQY